MGLWRAKIRSLLKIDCGCNRVLESDGAENRFKHYKVDGAEKTLLGTQMESSDARRLFPCWDEPTIKATFKIACITSVMATYLVVLFCGEFEKVSDQVG